MDEESLQDWYDRVFPSAPLTLDELRNERPKIYEIVRRTYEDYGAAGRTND